MISHVVQFFLTFSAMLLAALGIVGLFIRQRFISLSRANFMVGCSNSLLAVEHMIGHRTAWAMWSAGMAAIAFWIWWHKGGGDDTKRRLREALKKFKPVRRTAPVTS